LFNSVAHTPLIETKHETKSTTSKVLLPIEIVSPHNITTLYFFTGKIFLYFLSKKIGNNIFLK